MASESFRDSLNSLGWNRRDPDLPVRTSASNSSTWSKLQTYNPFSNYGSLRLPTDESPGAPLPARNRREEEDAWFAHESWSMASVLFLASWAALMGPMAYVRHLVSGPRLPFTATYFGSIALTLYFAIGWRSTILTLVTAIVQMICLIWYIVSYFPMGSSGLRLAASFGTNRVAAWMNG
ncbi:MAG: hypothetical protein Q9159_003889 [Coniocarpon cinnabarinum]